MINAKEARQLAEQETNDPDYYLIYANTEIIKAAIDQNTNCTLLLDNLNGSSIEQLIEILQAKGFHTKRFKPYDHDLDGVYYQLVISWR